MHGLKSHFQRDFLAYCNGPVSVRLAMACVSCSFDSFSVFLLSLKQQQILMKIMFSCIHFPIWPYLPKLMKNLFFILVNCMGWQVWIIDIHNHIVTVKICVIRASMIYWFKFIGKLTAWLALGSAAVLQHHHCPTSPNTLTHPCYDVQFLKN